MTSQRGIALVTSLITLVVVMALGVGAFALANFNLKVVENERSAVLAKADAESDITAAVIVMQKQFESSSTKEFPTTLTIPTINNTAAFGTGDYTYNRDGSGTGYNLIVTGKSANSGLYQSRVLVAGTASTSSTTTTGSGIYGKGLLTEGTVSVNGGANYIDTTLQGNAGFTLNSYSRNSFQTCTVRNLITAACTFPVTSVNTLGMTNTNSSSEAYKNELAQRIPVAAATGRSSYTCNPYGGDVCSGNTPRKKVTPVTVDITYTVKRDAAVAEADVRKATPARSGDGTDFNGIRCDKTYSSMPNAINSVSDANSKFLGSYKVICVKSGNVTLPNGVNLTGRTIISQDGMNFNGAPTLNNSQLISLNGGININGSYTVADSKIFSQNALNFNGSASFTGDTTIASGGSIGLNGSSEAVKQSAGKFTIGLAVIAGGDVYMNGGANWYASIVSGGTTYFNGSTNLYGGVAAKGNIVINGSINVDSGLEVTNSTVAGTTITTTTVVTPKVISRR